MRVVEVGSIIGSHILHASPSTGCALAHYRPEEVVEHGWDLGQGFEQSGPLGTGSIVNNKQEVPATRDGCDRLSAAAVENESVEEFFSSGCGCVRVGLAALGTHGAYVALVHQLDVFAELVVSCGGGVLERLEEDVVGRVAECAVNVSEFDERLFDRRGRGPLLSVIRWGWG